MQLVTEWRIHIGAHKTATTHLQDTLAAQRAALAERGIDYIPRNICSRERLADTLRGRQWRRLFVAGSDRRQWDDILATSRQGAATVVLSEEGVAGGLRDLLLGPLYPHAENRLQVLLSRLGSENVRLFLSIRSYDTLLPSAYIQAIRHVWTALRWQGLFRCNLLRSVRPCVRPFDAAHMGRWP